MEFLVFNFADVYSPMAYVDNGNRSRQRLFLGRRRVFRKKSDETSTGGLEGEKNANQSKGKACDFNHAIF